MKTYIKNGFEYFYDTNESQWVLYPVDKLGDRIEWDENDNPIEAEYFNNKTELNAFLNNNLPETTPELDGLRKLKNDQQVAYLTRHSQS